MKNTILFLLFGLFINACNPPVTENNSELKFFDLKSYLSQEINSLKNRGLKKIIKIDNETDEIIIENPDWEKEFALLLDSDINKTAWQDKYSITEKNGSFIYQTEDENLTVKKLQVLKTRDGQVDKIQIIREKENLLYKSNEKIFYRPNFGFQIIADRKVVLANPQKIEINIEFQ